MATLKELIEGLTARIEELEDELYDGVEYGPDGSRTYVFGYPIRDDEFRFVASDTVNAPIIELNIDYVYI